VYKAYSVIDLYYLTILAIFEKIKREKILNPEEVTL